MLDRLRVYLFSRVSSSSLGVLRILIGLCLLKIAFTYFEHDFSGIRRLIDIPVRFNFYGFQFVQPFEEDVMKGFVIAMMILAVFITVGVFYHVMMFLYGIIFTYVFLLEMTVYLNHYYMINLLCFMFAFLPLNHSYSIDSLIWKYEETVPFVCYWIVRVELVIVYFYAGIAKINVDWLIRGQPVARWLAKLGYIPFWGKFLMHPWNGVILSWCGFLLDILIAPMSIFDKYKWICVFFTTCFHLSNMVLWNIGIFPWYMLSITTIFFSPDWPLKLFRIRETTQSEISTSRTKQNIILFVVAILLIHQTLVPLRHNLYEGDVNWTEEGHLYSWRMKLRDKYGVFEYFLTNPETNITKKVFHLNLISKPQLSAIQCRSDHIHILAHYIANQYLKETNIWPIVKANVICSLNYRGFQKMVDENFDLASTEPWENYPKQWVIKLNSPWTQNENSVSKEEYIALLKEDIITRKQQTRRWIELVESKTLDPNQLYLF